MICNNYQIDQLGKKREKINEYEFSVLRTSYVTNNVNHEK